MNWLKTLFGGSKSTGDGSLDTDREVQSLKLQLREHEQTIAKLRNELERIRSSETERLQSDLRSQIERLLSEAAAPVTQLITQIHLLDVERKPVQARDVATVAKRLTHALEEIGMTLQNEVGETVRFDPNRHEQLSSDVLLSPGEEARVRFVGVSYMDKIIRKVGVEKCRDG